MFSESAGSFEAARALLGLGAWSEDEHDSTADGGASVPDYQDTDSDRQSDVGSDSTQQRTRRFSASALAVLEETFRNNDFPSVAERKDIAAEIKVTPRQVQVWFQNKRQRLNHPKASEQPKVNRWGCEAWPNKVAPKTPSPKSHRPKASLKVSIAPPLPAAADALARAICPSPTAIRAAVTQPPVLQTLPASHAAPELTGDVQTQLQILREQRMAQIYSGPLMMGGYPAAFATHPAMPVATALPAMPAGDALFGPLAGRPSPFGGAPSKTISKAAKVAKKKDKQGFVWTALKVPSKDNAQAHKPKWISLGSESGLARAGA